MSTPSMATMPCCLRYAGTLIEERQLDGAAHMSCTTMPRSAGVDAPRAAEPG